jgi:transcriptional regulator with XRE-family HTH domain
MLALVNAERLGWLARTLRVRQRLTQAMLGARAGVSRQAVSLLERGRARELRLATVESILGALGARADLRVLWNGPELDRLLDEGHAALGASVKHRLERWGWAVRVEVSFSRYGERGRIDLLGWQPVTRTLLVIEIKTELVDVQALLGSLDTKARLARHAAGRFGWEVASVVPAIVFAEDRTTRNRLARLSGLFDAFDLRGRAATSWLRRPAGVPSGIIWLTDAGQRRSRSAAPRVRARRRAA